MSQNARQGFCRRVGGAVPRTSKLEMRDKKVLNKERHGRRPSSDRTQIVPRKATAVHVERPREAV